MPSHLRPLAPTRRGIGPCAVGNVTFVHFHCCDVTFLRCAGAGKLLCLDRKAFTELLGDLQQLRHTWRFEALRRVPLLQQLSHAARGQLCDIFEQVVVPKKTRIVNQGDPGDAFYIVETGVLAVIKDGKPIMRLSPGQVRRCQLPLRPRVASPTLRRPAAPDGGEEPQL